MATTSTNPITKSAGEILQRDELVEKLKKQRAELMGLSEGWNLQGNIEDSFRELLRSYDTLSEKLINLPEPRWVALSTLKPHSPFVLLDDILNNSFEFLRIHHKSKKDPNLVMILPPPTKQADFQRRIELIVFQLSFFDMLTDQLAPTDADLSFIESGPNQPYYHLINLNPSEDQMKKSYDKFCALLACANASFFTANEQKNSFNHALSLVGGFWYYLYHADRAKHKFQISQIALQGDLLQKIWNFNDTNQFARLAQIANLTHVAVNKTFHIPAAYKIVHAPRKQDVSGTSSRAKAKLLIAKKERPKSQQLVGLERDAGGLSESTAEKPQNQGHLLHFPKFLHVPFQTYKSRHRRNKSVEEPKVLPLSNDVLVGTPPLPTHTGTGLSQNNNNGQNNNNRLTEIKSQETLPTESAGTPPPESMNSNQGGLMENELAHEKEVKTDSLRISARLLSYEPLPLKPRNDNAPVTLILHFHGGGFMAMSSFTHQDYCRKWCKYLSKEMPSVILSIDYRLAPQFPYPAAVDDCFGAYKWALENVATLIGQQPDKFIVTGDSAGGNLTAVVALKAIEEGLRIPDGVVMSYPVTNLTRDAPFPSRILALHDPILPYAFLELAEQSYIPEEYDAHTDPYLSPCVASNELLKQFPPAFIAVGTHDPLYHDALAMADRLSSNGRFVQMVVYNYLPHGYLSFGLKKGFLFKGTSHTIKHAAEWMTALAFGRHKEHVISMPPTKSNKKSQKKENLQRQYDG
eukprot:TRINITY_DN10389_c0_g1_i1.p1 TRINITY_DN10389_c0_g1~~TRINITY_DN10389_c0_g1_i1.p1  ORF type:complete len:779 (+),score=145.03 TRINITY_DN10389_c0_g1_i1:98-2338(+)